MSDRMTLGDMIANLEAREPGAAMRITLHSPHSYRGYYECLSFEYDEEATPVASTLALLRDQVGKVYTGWKGGEFRMGLSTPVYLAEEGRCGDAMSGLLLKLLVT